jgi:hypothetical protein
MRRHGPLGALALGALLAGCTGSGAGDAPETALASPTAVAAPPEARPTATAPAPPTPTPSPQLAVFDVTAAQRVLADLAALGPREATGPAFALAADYVQTRLASLGYQVRRQPVDVPAGESWGVPVPAGSTVNVVAALPGTDVEQPHVVVGAHLDTVPQSPGAVDNASGIAVLLETARLAAQQPPSVPLVLVAFGAEEPRGPGDDLHHFGSQAYVGSLTPAQRQALVGAVAIDSVGVSADVPVCSAVAGGDPFTDTVRQSATAAGIPVRTCENRTSDHWSFVRNGLPGVRVGLAGLEEYRQYHSADDVPVVVDLEALARAGGAVWAAVDGR